MFVNSDFSDLLRLFNASHVRYLVIDGYAVIQYAEPRFTADLGLWTGTEPRNAGAVYEALREFGAPLSGLTAEDFAEEGYFYQMGVPPVRVDVLMGIPSIGFEEAWARRLEIDFDGLPVPFISREDLITAKRALGSASILKVISNYLATANLVSCCEALVTAKAAGLDLNTTWEAMRISSGNSFVHETESEVILNGSRDISFTMDLVSKDIGLFQTIADRHGIPVELNPVMIEIFRDGAARYGAREWSPNIIRRLEDATGLSILAPGFPAQMIDDEPEEPGYEVIPKGRS